LVVKEKTRRSRSCQAAPYNHLEIDPANGINGGLISTAAERFFDLHGADVDLADEPVGDHASGVVTTVRRKYWRNGLASRKRKSQLRHLFQWRLPVSRTN